MQTKPILLIEDNPDDIELTRRAFKRSNVLNELHVVTDGTEALEYLFEAGSNGQHKPLPALILLDLKLPHVDGFQVLERVRADERTREIPVIVLTSSREQADEDLGYKYGVSSFMRKPVDFDGFIRVVQRIGLYWLAVNDRAPESQENGHRP